jgi:hypothetical protein
MILSLAKAQLNATLSYMEDPVFTQWREPFQVTATKWELEMPAVGWLRIFEAMERDTLNTRGQNLAKFPRTTIKARNNIRRALNEREAHPAMQGRGMMGWSSLVLPAWPKWAGSQNDWSPYPVEGSDMVLLTPRQMRQFTIWHAEHPHIAWRDRLAQEERHLALAGAVL